MRPIIIELSDCPRDVKKFKFQALRKDYDEGDAIGHGATEIEALQELLELEE